MTGFAGNLTQKVHTQSRVLTVQIYSDDNPLASPIYVYYKWTQLVEDEESHPKLQIFIGVQYVMFYLVGGIYCNLCSRKVDIQDICPLCLGDSETILHILVNCPFSRQVWTLSHLGFRWSSAISFGEWFQQASNSLTLENLSYVSMVCWALWTTRNDMVWRQKSRNPGAVISLASGVWHAWKEAKLHGLVVPSPANSNRTWSPPPFNWLKVNFNWSGFWLCGIG
ncbi:uncharacterized protein LOC119370713 [Jatropha curcas]|uniref:uncharacterized protein LOC119370713 n=1 Tax=Jatropha curcas TaxID=180498 RepID=UPI0018945495|nr:uncharacterized protein LOC119370713 [Jatropha curcas]